MMIVSIGEILFDQFPDYRRIGGAPFNVAAHLSSFGLKTDFITRVGNDKDGDELRSVISSYGLDPKLVQEDAVYPTGRVEVTLDPKGNARFQIIRPVAYDFLEVTPEALDRVSRADLIYVGTLIQRSPRGFDTVHTLLQHRKPTALVLCDINLRPDCYTEKTIRETLKKTDILKLNREEMQILSQLFSGPEQEEEMLTWLMDSFSFRMISLTADADGSRLMTPKGSYSMKPKAELSIRDTVGAGDAYASVLAAGILLNWDPEKILKNATDFAGKVCTLKGALPESPGFYTPIKKEIHGDNDD
jgi:fructokinase